MPDNTTQFPPEHAQRILESHIKVSLEKPLSYLPLNTIISVLTMDVARYRSLFDPESVHTLAFLPENCCIKSGAVYAYHETGLKSILDINKDILRENGWPSDPIQFVNRIAMEWLDRESAVLPVISRAFGES